MAAHDYLGMTEFIPVEEIFVTTIGNMETEAGIVRLCLCSREGGVCVCRVKLLIPEDSLHMLCDVLLRHCAERFMKMH